MSQAHPPVLWHLKVSHYSEKARWALDHKHIAHLRRTGLPGRHAAIGKRLTGSATFPVLELAGEVVGDSTKIIAALERTHPRPPLYPDDPAERRRALELEDYFDEQLGPHTRLLAVHHMLGAPEVTLGAFFPDVGGPGRRALRAAFPLVRAAMVRRLGIGERSVALAYERLEAAAERFRCELQPSGYLVGERFSVADLTLAALLAPLVAPREYPYLQPQRRHPLFAPPRELLSRAALLDWTRAMYSRHRGYSAEMPATEARREPVEPAETLAVAGGAKR